MTVRHWHYQSRIIRHLETAEAQFHRRFQGIKSKENICRVWKGLEKLGLDHTHTCLEEVYVKEVHSISLVCEL